MQENLSARKLKRMARLALSKEGQYVNALVVALLVGLINGATSSNLILIFISFIISVGYAKFNIDLINGEKSSLEIIFNYFSDWKRILIANLLVMLKTFLWSLLFIIPGIIVSYSYALVPYILAENTTLSETEVLDLSKRMMKGNKWKLFKLDLSFIGWILLCFLTAGIGFIFLQPYQSASKACFYKELAKNYKGYFTNNHPDDEEIYEAEIFSE